MSRVNIAMPDDLYQRARQAGLNVSQLAQRAITEELDRLAKIAELDIYLAHLEAELGPPQRRSAAIVVAMADRVGGAAVLTTDPRDPRVLARRAANDVRISSV